MYVCGVTPYDKLHIGHARAFLTYDALRRVLESRGLKVRHVQNVTDIDDKIIVRATEIGEDPLQLASNYHEESLRELALLDVLPAHEYPREVEFVPDLPTTATGKIIRRELKQREIERKKRAGAVSAAGGARG